MPRPPDSFAKKEVLERLELEIKSFMKGTKAESSRLDDAIQVLENKYRKTNTTINTKYLPMWVKSVRNQVTHQNSKIFLCAPAPLWKTQFGWI